MGLSVDDFPSRLQRGIGSRRDSEGKLDGPGEHAHGEHDAAPASENCPTGHALAVADDEPVGQA